MTGIILQLATSRGIVIAISLLVSPVLGRLFPPHAFGALVVLTTLVSVLSAFASLSYVSAIPIAGTLNERRDLCVISFGISLVVTVVVALLAVWKAEALAIVFHEPDVRKYVLFLPLMLLGDALRQLLDTTLSCQRRFGAVSLRNVIEAVVTRMAQIGANLAGWLSPPVALIIGALTGNYMAALIAGRISLSETFHKCTQPPSWEGLFATAAKYRKFPFILLWSQTVNAVTLGLPALLLGMRFSVDVVGWYGMAFSLVTLPLSLFSSSAGQVFYIETGQRIARGQSVEETTRQLVSVLALLTSFPLITVLLLGPFLFETFLGSQWHEAGVYAQVLSPWIGLGIFGLPLSLVYTICNRQGEGFGWNLTLLAARFLALYVGGMQLGARYTLGLFVALSVIILACQIARALHLVGVDRRWVAERIARSYLKAIILLTPAAVLYWRFETRWWTGAALGAACLIFSLSLCWQHPNLVKSHLLRHS